MADCGCERHEDHGSCAACDDAGCGLTTIVNHAMGWCGCDTPEAVDVMMRAYLATMRTDAFPRPRPEGVDDGAWMLLRYMADGLGWTEHGTTVGGAWLTDKGAAVLARMDELAA